jgi:hypothetical protein
LARGRFSSSDGDSEQDLDDEVADIEACIPVGGGILGDEGDLCLGVALAMMTGPVALCLALSSKMSARGRLGVLYGNLGFALAGFGILVLVIASDGWRPGTSGGVFVVILAVLFGVFAIAVALRLHALRRQINLALETLYGRTVPPRRVIMVPG